MDVIRYFDNWLGLRLGFFYDGCLIYVLYKAQGVWEHHILT